MLCLFLVFFLQVWASPTAPQGSDQGERYMVFYHSNASVDGLSANGIKLAGLNGIIRQLDAKTADRLRSDSKIAKIVKDKKVRVAPLSPQASKLVSQTGAPWGLAAISQSQRPLPESLRTRYKLPSSNGAGTIVYLIDSGVDVNHPDLKGRAFVGPNYSSTPNNNNDEYGHGTHVAGTILGTKFGVAKKATLSSIKILDKNGDGWYSSAINAIQWVVQQHKSRGPGAKSVINMSFSGDNYPALDLAVEGAVNAGIIVVVCAGNLAVDACTRSPAASPLAITVAAGGLALASPTRIKKRRTWKNVFADFSNYGSCIDIIAPGVDVLSSVAGGKRRVYSGTSMAAPHVAGAAAIWLSQSPANNNPANFKIWLNQKSLKNVVDFVNFPNAAQNTTNEFLFLG